MSAAVDKVSMEPDAQSPSGTTSYPSSEVSSILPLPSEIRSQTQPINEYSSAIMRDLTTLSQKLQKEVDQARLYVPKGSDYLKRVRNFVSTSEEKELYEKVRDQLIAVIHRSKNNAHCEREAKLSSEIRQTVDAIYKRLKEKLTVDEIRAEFKPFKNLFSQAPSVEDNELLFKAKMALIRALRDAEAKEHAAAWASYGFQDPQHPSGMSHFLRSQIKCQIMNLTMKKDREAILTMGYKAAQAQNEQRLAQARKEFEIMLNEEPSQDKKEEKVVVDKEPVMTQPQVDSQVIVKYLELKLQSRESEIDSLNVKLDEQTKRSEETISDLTGELEASKNREKQLKAEIEELKRNQESSQLIDQNLSDYINELTEEIYTTKDILNATQYEAIKLKKKCQNAEKLVQQVIVKIEFEEKENCKFRDEVVNLEAMIQNMHM
ncbi:hypothetical protein CAEBREN_29872 [Caenorhabditis brenneri]|uniref:Uncharacterized protein n=1 Tax=Caenorhabditis brenneri TaxID=135651 RepID=G0P2R7_CAEBE|nr:hypothetical protein CAEBREN_29872 [Caenorhabditis brenneri]